MRWSNSMALIGAGALLLSLPGCLPDDSEGDGPAVRGVYRATYEVPVVSAELASAAVYDVPEVEWEIKGGMAELSYDLPLGLVGKAVRVKFAGPLDAGAAASELTGEPGTAACAVTSSAVVCNEDMAGLLPLSPDYAVIEQVAKAEYAGPAADRVNVAKAFSADPIGIVRVDLGAPAAGELDDEDEDEPEKPED